MQCMKCGREIGDEQVFCDNCLAIMEKYPIKPSTHIHLPKRELPAVKVSRKKVLSPEEQVVSLRSTIRRLWVIVCVLLIALGCVTWMYFSHDHNEPEVQEPPIGQNFTVNPNESNKNENVPRETIPSLTKSGQD